MFLLCDLFSRARVIACACAAFAFVVNIKKLLNFELYIYMIV